MKAVVQRVTSAEVTIEKENSRKIGHGLVILLGIEATDNDEDIHWLCHKISHLRIFDDGSQTMNRSLIDTTGEALVVSQFTLHASTKKGNRPSYTKAAKPSISKPLYDKFITTLNTMIATPCTTGTFGADMQVSLTNDGPVTIIIDTKHKE